MDVEVMKNTRIWCHTIDCGNSVAWLLIFVFTTAQLSPRQRKSRMRIGKQSKSEWLIRLPHFGSCGTVCILITYMVLTNQARGQSGGAEWCPYRPAGLRCKFIAADLPDRTDNTSDGIADANMRAVEHREFT